MVLLDATYKTSKYALPLFQMCVKINAGYKVVASFVVEHETIEEISAALKVIKSWNDKWRYEFFMMDYQNEEIKALESIFPGTMIFI